MLINGLEWDRGENDDYTHYFGGVKVVVFNSCGDWIFDIAGLPGFDASEIETYTVEAACQKAVSTMEKIKAVAAKLEEGAKG